jgi:hypothetical protein
MRQPLVIALCLMTFAHVSSARQLAEPENQNARSTEIPKRLPELNGHRFFPALAVGNPFVRSAVVIATGGGYVGDLIFRFEHPDFGELLRLKGDLGFLVSNLNYEYALDDYVSLRFNGDVLARIATSEESVLSQGITAVVGYEMGMRVRIWETDKFYTSVTGSFSRSSLIGITPLQFVQKVIEEGYNPNAENDLVRTELSARFLIGGDIAYAPTAYLGFIGHAGFGASNPFEDGLPDIPISNFGVSVHLDLGPLTSTPVGFTLGLVTNSLSPAANDFARRTVAGIIGVSYTGRRDFDFGIEMATSRIKQSDTDDTFTAGLVQFRSTYYF